MDKKVPQGGKVMKRLLLLLCIVLMASGCVPKANQFSLKQKKTEIEKASKKRSMAVAELTKAISGREILATSGSITDSEAQEEAKQGSEKAHAECLVMAHTSFAVMLGDIISILSGEFLWGDLASKLTTTTFNQTTFADPLKLRTTKEVVNTCLKSKGFPPIEDGETGGDQSSSGGNGGGSGAQGGADR